jgi:hypothetical protein
VNNISTGIRRSTGDLCSLENLYIRQLAEDNLRLKTHIKHCGNVAVVAGAAVAANKWPKGGAVELGWSRNRIF